MPKPDGKKPKNKIDGKKVKDYLQDIEGKDVPPVFLKKAHKDEFIEGKITGERNVLNRKKKKAEDQVRVDYRGVFAWYSLEHVYVEAEEMGEEEIILPGDQA